MAASSSSSSVYRGAGFDFSNSVRNDFLEAKGVAVPKATSTGTTIVGCLFQGGIVLGADTRATSGPIVADKNCEKVCCCCIGGTRRLTTRILDPLHCGQHSVLWCWYCG